MYKPDVDLIEGLSPAISIEQKTTSKNPRSTVATVTEIYDYLRLLYARVGRPFCYRCGKPIASQTVSQIVDSAGAAGRTEPGLAHRARAQEYRQISSRCGRGFVRVRVNGALRPGPAIELDKNKKQRLPVDRLVVSDTLGRRLADSLETALKLAEGIVTINQPERGQDLTFSERMACIECGVSYPEISPRIFSFNNPHGACPACDGLGTKVDLRAASLDPSLRELGEEFFGASLGALDRPETSPRAWEEIESYVERLASVQPCPECDGARLRK
jgi:excinuclease ABC subunit A